MESVLEYRIITNNPLAASCLPEEYRVELWEALSYRQILVKVRDLVYAGHRLYTHPLSGSVKPNETPYKSIVISRNRRTMDSDEALLIASAVETFDKFAPRNRRLTEEMYRDFQLIDYTLLCGALDLDAAAGLSKKNGQLYSRRRCLL